MIDPSMDALINYLMKLRGEPMMPPQQQQPEINPAIAQVMQMAQQNPMVAGNLGAMEGSAADPAGGSRMDFGGGRTITNQDLPQGQAEQSQPAKKFDPSYEWNRDANGTVYWKPKGSNTGFIPYRG